MKNSPRVLSLPLFLQMCQGDFAHHLWLHIACRLPSDTMNNRTQDEPDTFLFCLKCCIFVKFVFRNTTGSCHGSWALGFGAVGLRGTLRKVDDDMLLRLPWRPPQGCLVWPVCMWLAQVCQGFFVVIQALRPFHSCSLAEKMVKL